MHTKLPQWPFHFLKFNYRDGHTCQLGENITVTQNMNEAYGKEMDANYACFLVSSEGRKVPWRGGKKRGEIEKACDKRNIYLLMASWWERIAAIPSFDDALQAASYFFS